MYTEAKVSAEPEGLRLKPSPTHKGSTRQTSTNKALSGIGKEKALVNKTPPKPIRFDPSLDGETYVKAREVAPGLDIYAIEVEWKEWVVQSGQIPKNPDGAFLGFCKKKVEQHGEGEFPSGTTRVLDNIGAR